MSYPFYARAVWLNRVPENRWAYTPSIGKTQELMGGRMYPLTLGGIEDAMAGLKR